VIVPPGDDGRHDGAPRNLMKGPSGLHLIWDLTGSVFVAFN
jgi:hypothetical protein